MPRIQHKRGTSANLASVNPTPLAGELVWDSTENAVKIGDGSTAWTSLAYVTATPRSHTHAISGVTGLQTALDAKAPLDSPTFTGQAAFANTGDVVPLTVTNTGTANSFVVNDESGEATPFVISADGRVGVLTPSPASAIHVSHSEAGVAQFERRLSESPTSGQGQQVAFSIGVSGATGSGVIFIHRSYDTTTATRISRNHIRMYDTGIAIEDGSSVDVVAFNTTNLQSVFSGVILADDATSTSAPVYSFTGDTNCGIAHPAADTIALSTAGSERLRVDSSGRLGIGTTSPTATLDVNADTMRLRTARTPASASATGNAGDICWDADYLYIAVATNTWRRISHASW